MENNTLNIVPGGNVVGIKVRKIALNFITFLLAMRTARSYSMNAIPENEEHRQ